MARALRLLLVAALLLVPACASREKKRGVLVTHNREQVTECAFLGRVNPRGAAGSEGREPGVPESGISELELRQEAARMGANVLLILSYGGLAEAYLCEKRVIFSASAKQKQRPTASGLPRPVTPTPGAVWPAGSPTRP